MWRSASPSATFSLVLGGGKRRAEAEARTGKTPPTRKIHETRVTSAKANERRVSSSRGHAWRGFARPSRPASASRRVWPVAVARELAPHGHARRAAGRRGWCSPPLLTLARLMRAASRQRHHQKKGGSLTLLLERGSVHGPRHATTTRSIASSSSSASAAGRPAGLGFWRPYRLRYCISYRPTDAMIGSLFHADTVMVQLGR